MQTPDLANLSLRESSELPANTLVAPISIIREIRLMLGSINIDMQVGIEDVVVVSSDLYEAFSKWNAAQGYEDESGADDSWLN